MFLLLGRFRFSFPSPQDTRIDLSFAHGSTSFSFSISSDYFSHSHGTTQRHLGDVELGEALVASGG